MPDVDEAIATVRELAAGQARFDPGWDSVPHDARPYLQSHGGPLSHRQIAAATWRAPAELVPLADLTPTQDWLDAAEVEAYLRDPERRLKKGTTSARTGARIDLPTVVRWGGDLYIHDGHHRSFAEMAKGESEVAARVVDADEMGLESWSRARASEDE